MAITLIVETGAGVENANTYVSIDTCNDYHANLGNTAWAGADEEKKQAILRTMAWMETLAWDGVKLAFENALEWPRKGIVTPNGYNFPEDAVPWQVRDAVCEGALVEIAAKNGLRPALKRGGGIKSERVEGAVAVEYFPGAPSGVKYTAIRSLLLPYLKTITHVRRV